MWWVLYSKLEIPTYTSARLPCRAASVSSRSFARIYSEELRIELIDAVEEPAAARIGSPRLGRIRVIHRWQMPAIFGNLGDRINAIDQQIPQIVRTFHSARQTTTNPNNSNRLDVHARYRSAMIK